MSGSILRSPEVTKIDQDVLTLLGLEEYVEAYRMKPKVMLGVSFTKPAVRRMVKKYILDKETGDYINKQAFETEVQIMQSFNHPYIAKCLMAYEYKDYLAICMNYYSTRTLDDFVNYVRPDVSEKYICQAACALRYLHKNNVVHFNITLEHIFIDVENNAILGNFGSAAVLQPGQKTVAKSQCKGYLNLRGSREREAYDGQDQLDPYKLDAFSFGVVVWAMMMAKHPKDDNYIGLAKQRQDLPGHIMMRELMMKLLDRDPESRITVTAFLEEFRNVSIVKDMIDSH